MNSSMCLVLLASVMVVIITSLPVNARESDRENPLGALLKSIFTPPNKKPVKSGIVEPSAIVDSAEVGGGKDGKDDDPFDDLTDFLTPSKDKKKKNSRSENKRREGFLSGLFRTLSGEKDLDTASSNIDEIDEDTTTKKSSLFRPLFGDGSRFAGAIRSSARDGWRSFLKRALPALFA